MKPAAAARLAFQAPSRRLRRSPALTAAIIAASDKASMAKKSCVRWPIVSGSPTAGGLAGYLIPGTRITARKAASASSADRPRGPMAPTRPEA